MLLGTLLSLTAGDPIRDSEVYAHVLAQKGFATEAATTRQIGEQVGANPLRTAGSRLERG